MEFFTDPKKYNGGHGPVGTRDADARNPNLNKPFFDLLSTALGQAEAQAKDLAKDCGRCKCPDIKVRFNCRDNKARDWGNWFFNGGRANMFKDWQPNVKKTLCEMYKSVPCEKAGAKK